MIKTLATMAFAFAVLFVANTDTAEAQGYLGQRGYGGFGLLSSPYALGRVPDPPYFAIHPPVYYSQPVARTYGYSPYAYPGSVRTPEVKMEKATAKAISNPYATPTKSKSTKKFDMNLTKVVEPMEIVNPFVTQSKTKMVSVK